MWTQQNTIIKLQTIDEKRDGLMIFIRLKASKKDLCETNYSDRIFLNAIGSQLPALMS